MKKFILSILFVALGFTFLSAQECTLRLEMPDPMPNPGEDFYVGVYMDVLEYPGYTQNGANNFLPTLKSGQIGMNYDPAVLTALETDPSPIPPFAKYWYHDLNTMFTAYTATPAANEPSPGDIRFVSYTLVADGMDPSYFGFVSGSTPLLMWNLKFNYIGGDIAISFQDAVKMTKVDPTLSGGTKDKIVTYWTAWDDAAYAMTYVNYPAAVDAVTWTGNESENWFTGGNWDSGSVPGSGDDVIIPASPVGPNMPTIWDFANVMGLENNGTITIDPDGGLYSAALIMNGGELVNNGTIIMKSVLAPPGGPGAPASTVLGQIVPDVAFGMSGMGTYEVDRLMNMTASAEPFKDGWHLLSSPVDGVTTDDIPNYYLNTWNEMALGDPDFPWVHIEGDPQAPCTPVAPALPIGEMEGWSVKQDMDWASYGCPGGTDDVIEMMGSAWAMPYSTPVTLTGATAHAGYNLVGNPFFCGLDLLSVDWAGVNAHVNPMAYVYEEGNQAYQPLDGLVADPFVGNTVAPTVGFFVMANASGDFMLDGSEQVLAFGGAAKSTVENTLIIKATSSSHYDYMRIRFMNEATEGFDNNWDAYKFISEANGLPQIYTPAGEDMLAISSMEATQMVPMHFTSATSGNFTIEAIEASDFPEVYLQDLVTGTITDLLANDYEFNYTQGENQSRFIIHFAPVGINDINAGTVNIWSRDNNIMVNVPANVTGEIVVYNMMGQQVVRTDIQGVETQIQVSDVNTNYIVKVISKSNTVTGKVYVK